MSEENRYSARRVNRRSRGERTRRRQIYLLDERESELDIFFDSDIASSAESAQSTFRGFRFLRKGMGNVRITVFKFFHFPSHRRKQFIYCNINN
nr:unnamed protein product [Callosobruchus analis]